MGNVVPIPMDRYEVVDGKWTMVAIVGKGGVFGETDKMMILFKDGYKTLLTFFNKDIEML